MKLTEVTNNRYQQFFTQSIAICKFFFDAANSERILVKHNGNSMFVRTFIYTVDTVGFVLLSQNYVTRSEYSNFMINVEAIENQIVSNPVDMLTIISIAPAISAVLRECERILNLEIVTQDDRSDIKSCDVALNRVKQVRKNFEIIKAAYEVK